MGLVWPNSQIPMRPSFGSRETTSWPHTLPVNSSTMKFDQLRSIGHNIADSLASGIGLPIGIYETDVFAEAKCQTGQAFIIVDFLTGTCASGAPSASLARAITLYRDAFADLCKRHGTSPSAFQKLTAQYSIDALGRRFIVTVEDRYGHHADDEYVGTTGRRVRVVDHLGRVRPKTSSKPKS